MKLIQPGQKIEVWEVVRKTDQPGVYLPVGTHIALNHIGVAMATTFFKDVFYFSGEIKPCGYGIRIKKIK